MRHGECECADAQFGSHVADLQLGDLTGADRNSTPDGTTRGSCACSSSARFAFQVVQDEREFSPRKNFRHVDRLRAIRLHSAFYLTAMDSLNPSLGAMAGNEQLIVQYICESHGLSVPLATERAGNAAKRKNKKDDL